MYILVVDDDKLICENIRSKLSRLGYLERYDIISAYNATDAEILFERHHPQIVITDIHMPVISGLSLIERLLHKQIETNIFVLSGYNDYDYVRKAFLLGVTDYMLKPIDIDELGSKLSKITQQAEDTVREEIPSIKTEQDIMQVALKYVDDNVSRSLSMREVADNVGLSYNYFSRLFKQTTNSHFSSYVQQRRIELSKKYLQDPSFQIQEISQKLGYENPSEFSRVFKRYTGCYPTAYRNNSNNIDIENLERTE